VRLLLLLCVASMLAASTSAWAHGGEDHGEDEETPAASTSAATTATSSSGETSLGLRLSDLSQSGAGTEAPLVGAQIRGLLKRADTGATLARVSAHASDAPGSYDVHFNGDNATFAFPGAGRYELDLNIRPARGEAIDTTVPFSLDSASAPAPAPYPVPLWRRALPWALSVAALGVLFALVRKLLTRRRKTPPSAGGEGDAKKRAPEKITAAVLLLALLGGVVRVQAHGGEDHGEEEEAAPAAAPAPGSNQPAGGTSGSGAGVARETTSTTTAGNIRITVIARTTPPAPQVLGPGEVSLAPATAELLNIKTVPVLVSRLATGIAFSGQVAPDPNGVVRVASIVPGRVTRLNVAQGDVVRQGQVLAIVESRAIGEAQSAYQQALARFNNAQSSLDVVQQQARAGVFSRAPLEAAQRTQAEAAGDVRQGQASVQQAQVALNNASRVARVGGFASPALEAARNAQAQAREALRTAEAAQTTRGHLSGRPRRSWHGGASSRRPAPIHHAPSRKPDALWLRLSRRGRRSERGGNHARQPPPCPLAGR
jgi:biotin carboxyl carrier protein